MTRARELSKIINTSSLSVDSDFNVGIGSTLPTEKLDVGGDAKIGAAITMFSSSGIVSATSFHGDGSNLSGITAGATLSAASGSQRVVVTSLTSGTMTAAGTNADLAYNTTTNTLSATTFDGALSGNADTATSATNAQGLTGTPDITVRNVTGVAGTFTGFVAFSTSISVGGTITYEDVTNIDSIGVITARAGVQVGSGQSFGANGPTAVYYGDGSNLSGISAGGISTTKYSPTANAIIQIGLGTAQHHELILSAGFTTITTTGGTYGESHSLVLVQPSTGICTVGFSTYFLFPSGATPSMSEGSSKVDLVSFVVKDVTGNPGTGITELLASAGLNYQ